MMHDNYDPEIDLWRKGIPVKDGIYVVKSFVGNMLLAEKKGDFYFSIPNHVSIAAYELHDKLKCYIGPL